MKTQLSRKTFDALKRYSGVYQQMGRMLTDADWNELSDLNKDRLADVLTDIIGKGTPKDRGIMEITENGDGSYSYQLVWGYAYVDGIVCQVRPDANAILVDPGGLAFEYEYQADFPSAGAIPDEDYVLYLDVWDRTVTTLEDSDLIDAGLHGADTCTRTQTMAQIKWCPITIDPENAGQNPGQGNSLLSLQLRQGSTETDPCDPCADEISLQDNVGNYLFRVEIHDVVYDATGAAQRVFIKWSSENGAEQYSLTDQPAGFVSASWAYEFFNGAAEKFASEKHSGMHHVPGFTPKRGELVDEYSEPAGFSLVRRWDGFCELEKNAGSWTLVTGIDRGTDLSVASNNDAPGHFENGSAITINLESIILDLDLSDLQLVAGDYWQAPVRQATDVAGTEILPAQIPYGIQHHYMTLGSVIEGEFTAYQGDQCKRFEFPALTDINAKDVCYDSACDDFDSAKTVEDALDKLCQQNDLKWHNKHLHGWGIVCGLIVQCNNREGCNIDNVEEMFDDLEPELSAELDAQRAREAVVTSGYALTCEGEDVNLKQNEVVDVISQIEQLEAAGALILDELQNGTVCLRIELDNDCLPRVVVEPLDPDMNANSIFDGTLIMDFYQDCIVDLIEEITGEFKFLNAEELEVVEGGNTGLVSAQRRKFVSFFNLIIQLFNTNNGRYVLLSHKEHLILRDLYLRLVCLLRSKTFCGMFEGQTFPDYPFPETGMTTYFGKNNHTRLKMHPSGEQVYSYGGADNTINIYDVKAGELIEVLEMPAVDGAEISAITFSEEGEILYAAASVRGIDSVFGRARINDDHAWEKMIVLCNIEIMEMQVSARDSGLIYALGYSKGLFYLRPEVLLDEEKPQPVPVYSFNAVAHMEIDVKAGHAYCTSSSSELVRPVNYNEIVVCDLNQSGEQLSPTTTLLIQIPGANGFTGTDGIALGPERLFVIVDGVQNQKQLWTYQRDLFGDGQTPIELLNLENTQIALAYHTADNSLLLAMEDGYRLQKVDNEGRATEFIRIPVQIQPVDVIVDSNSNDIFVLNFAGNTISFIPAQELNISEVFLNTLTQYRTAIFLAFYNLLGGLLQYLKDCFCDHLLVKCPTCDDEKLYLAKVEIKNNEVYNICNFDKRKYVKSFPTVDYWLSVIPIMPLVKKAVSSICCKILPNIFSKYQGRYVTAPLAGTTHHRTYADSNTYKASTTRQGMQTYQRTDLGELIRDNTKSLNFLGLVAKDEAVNQLDTGSSYDRGLKKNVLIDSSVTDAQTVLQKNQIEITEVKEYDPTVSREHFVNYVATPERIEPGSKVTLYQKDGKVAYYAVEKAPVSGVELSPSAKLEIEQFELRKTALSDLSQLGADYSALEARKSAVTELVSVRSELVGLQAEKADFEAEIVAIKSQVESVKSTRLEEERKLQELSALRTTVASDIVSLNDNLLAIELKRKEIDLEITKIRPPREVISISVKDDVALQEFGIRTLQELADADATKITENSKMSKTTATRLINNAKKKLVR